MANSDSQFAGSIPEIYDRYLGPVIFQPHADNLARRVRALHPASIREYVDTQALARTSQMDTPKLA
jgi:hypothetical protein